MKIIIAHAELDGGHRPDAQHAAGLEAFAKAAGHAVEELVMPDRTGASPQVRALPWQLLACESYADAVWALNFPACALRHPSRRIWLTRAEPFGIDVRAPVAALPRLLDLDQGESELVVATAELVRKLGVGSLRHVIGMPPLVEDLAREVDARVRESA